MKTLPWRWSWFSERSTSVWARSLRARVMNTRAKSTGRFGGERLARALPGPNLPTPALRWVGEADRYAIRQCDWSADADLICLWQRETYALNFPHFRLTPEFHAAFRHDLRRALLDSDHALWMLDASLSGGSICGFVWGVLCGNNWTGERYGYINNLYIAPSERGMHLGEELLQQAESWFCERGVTKMRLTVTASNESARKLYERSGYATERFEMEKQISTGHNDRT